MSSHMYQSISKVNTDDMYVYRELSVNKLQHEYEVAVIGRHIKQKVDFELKKIKETAKIPGFRSGKVPYELIIKNYRNEALERTLNHFLDFCSADLMKKIEVESYTHPKLDIISLPDLDTEDEKSNLVYKLSFELIPEAPLIDISKIHLKKFEVKIEEDDIREFVDSMKVKFPSFVPIDDTSYQAQNGDRLTIDFEGRMRGKLFKGGSSKNFSVNLGSGTFISDFENQLIGMKKGEKKNLKVLFPEDYQVIYLAGQGADFFVQVNDIQIIKEFASDSDMAKSIGFEDHSSLINYATKAITNQFYEMVDFLIKKQLFDYLDGEYSFDIPTSVVNQEKQVINKELDDQNNSYQEAEKRVKLAMLLMKFSKENKVSIDKKDIDVVLSQYTRKGTSLNEVISYYNSDEKFQELIRGQALERKVTDYILEKVNKEQQIITTKELKKLFDGIE